VSADIQRDYEGYHRERTEKHPSSITPTRDSANFGVYGEDGKSRNSIIDEAGEEEVFSSTEMNPNLLSSYG
jgi:hypothetical protein